MEFTTPVGFRDVMSEEALAREGLVEAVQKRFFQRGYLPIETPTLEVLDVMQAGGHVPGSPFKFFDSHGDLLAMRPDVTMQIARMCATRLAGRPGPFKFRYTQRVFRENASEAAAREVTQMGVESIGESGPRADAEIVSMLADALTVCGLRDFTIAMGTASVLRSLLAKCDVGESWKQQVLDAYHASDVVELDRLVAAQQESKPYAQAIGRLPRMRGGREAISQVRSLVEPLGCAESLDNFEATFDLLAAEGLEDVLSVDFSIMSSFDYYTGIVFEAYSPKLGSPLGGGGRYDNLLGSYGDAGRPAAGFAFYLEQVMAAVNEQDAATRDILRIAVPKGSLNDDAIRVLSEAGLDTTGLSESGRTLLIRNPGVEYIIVRPTDAPVFVSLGAADCGICGKDSLLEADPDVVELVDLDFGGCRFIVAESAGTTQKVEDRYRKLGSIRVATKYPNITRSYFARIGMQAEIVNLHGNIELAPITGMAERIVDITATGTTLRENRLEIVDEVLSSTARFFANPCAFRTNPRVAELASALLENVQE